MELAKAEGESLKRRRFHLGITRRIFLDFLTKGILGVSVGSLLYPLVRYLIPPSKRSTKNSGIVEVDAAEIAVGKSKIINYRETPTIVIRTTDGIFALSAVCTHLGCIVQWDDKSQEIVCPCHGAKYDLNGNVKSGPAPKPLNIVKATIDMDNNKILIGNT